MNDSDDPNEEPVGYKKPPRKNRFTKTKSGNPGGRPKKKALDTDECLIALLEAKAQNSDYTIYEFLIKSSIKVAVQGDMRAVRFLVDNYAVAKGRRRSTTSDEEGDRAIVERILGADHSLVKDLDAEAAPTDADTPPEEKMQKSDD